MPSNLPREEYNAYMAKYMLKRYYKRRQYGYEKLGGVCVGCSIDESLDFHHKDPSTKSFTIGNMWSVSWTRFVTELEKCELRCKPCHHKIHACDHGITMYSHHKCRCQVCRDTWKEYHKRFKK